jgi:hypothetical protein
VKRREDAVTKKAYWMVQAAAALRQGKAEFDLVVVEGYDGPQP